MRKRTPGANAPTPPAQGGDEGKTLTRPREFHPAAVLAVGVLLELVLAAAVVGASARLAIGAELRAIVAAVAELRRP